jgi:hypothetical protein
MAAKLTSDPTAPSGRELYHLQFSRQVASPETFGYTFACIPPHVLSEMGAGSRKTYCHVTDL